MQSPYLGYMQCCKHRCENVSAKCAAISQCPPVLIIRPTFKQVNSPRPGANIQAVNFYIGSLIISFDSCCSGIQDKVIICANSYVYVSGRSHPSCSYCSYIVVASFVNCINSCTFIVNPIDILLFPVNGQIRRNSGREVMENFQSLISQIVANKVAILRKVS